MRRYGIFAGLAAASIWGGMYVVSKVVLEVIPPYALLSLRLILGAGGLAMILPWAGGFRVSPRAFIPLFLVGMVGFGISVGLQFVGTKLSTAANASLITSASPVFILLFGIWLLGERATGRRILALSLSTLGVMAVLNPGELALGASTFWGNLALVGAAITWGLYSVLIRKVSKQAGMVQISIIAFLGGLPVSLAMTASELGQIEPARITFGVILGVLYLGLVSTALAMYLWNKSLELLEAGVVSLLFFAQPVVGVSLGAILLHEPLGLHFMVGAALIAGGLLLGTRPARRSHGRHR
jgi:drug/metabolite transporter (DMT)-like permease